MRRKVGTIIAMSAALVLLSRPRMGTAYLSVGYVPEKTCFSVAYRGEVSSYKTTPMFVLPGENVEIDIASDDKDASYVLSDGWTLSGPQSYVWKAPTKAGLYSSTITEKRSEETITLQIFVLVPYGKMREDQLNGYRIGNYPHPSTKKTTLYAPPRGFIEVTPENKNTLLSPHFKLSQFLCKQGGGYPKYVVLRERLILKLEYLLEHVNAQGVPARTFSVMSGYRTPFYNKAIKNVQFSRHVWGDAADIYINNDPAVDVMDDLNADGQRNVEDAQVLYNIVNKLNTEPGFQRFIGGLGWYKPTNSHGPFVHVDARGTQANWSSN